LIERCPQEIAQKRLGFLKRALQVSRELRVDLAAPAQGAVNDFREQGSIAVGQLAVSQTMIEEKVGVGPARFHAGENLAGELAHAAAARVTGDVHRL
jgi:hypothetical protein